MTDKSEYQTPLIQGDEENKNSDDEEDGKKSGLRDQVSQLASVFQDFITKLKANRADDDEELIEVLQKQEQGI